MSVQMSSHALQRVRARVRTRLAAHEWVLVGLGSLQFLGFISFFVLMHLRSQAWARGQVLDPFKGYWAWFYRTIFSEEQVEAARRSAAAQAHPWWMLASLALLSGAYLLLLIWLRRQAPSFQPRLRVLLGMALIFSLPLLALPNLLSSDIYSYIAFGRIAAIHGGNPFIDPPSAYPSDRFYVWVNWKTVPSVYGPAWIYPSLLLTLIVESIRSHVIAYVLAYKLLALLLHLANGALIWAILTRWRPEQRVWGTALYLLCPLTLIEFAGNAHNDVLMITFILLGIWLHLRGAWLLTIGAWTLAVLTKWIALPLLPLYGLVLLWQARTWRQRITRALGALALCVMLCTALYAPYWEGWRTLEILVDAPPQQRLINSLADVASNEVQRTMWRLGRWPDPLLTQPLTIFALPRRGATLADDVDGASAAVERFAQAQRAQFMRDRSRFRVLQAEAKRNADWVNAWVRRVALAMLALSCLAAAAVTRTFRTALLAGAWIFFIYCTIGAVWFWPWYATWFVALAALLDWRVTARTALLLALLVPLIYVFFPPLPDPEWWQRYRAVLALGPALLFAGWQGIALVGAWWRARRGRRGQLRPA
ncbi:hypothetical protein [Kallotenue papyrolyticum]|uniref:hypothetical protein n=1 Tax=Kallotenue papyrolyticum TaxID=1325125 RepID=UPI0004AD6FB9|nr:hypothetical protein [Kallotenue papyrolyticum]